MGVAVANFTTSQEMKEDFKVASDYNETTLQKHKGTLRKRKISKPERKICQEKKKKPKLEATNFFRVKWDKFSQDVKDKINALRKAAKEVKKNKVAALETDKEEEAKKSAGNAMARKKIKEDK